MGTASGTRSVRSRVSVGIAGSALALTLLLGGCTAPGPDAASPSASASPPASASPTRSEVASPTPERPPVETPAPVTGEFARATFTEVGPDGIPQTASIAEAPVIGGGFRVEGACGGSSADYRVTTASVDTDKRVLTEGTMDCDGMYSSSLTGLSYEGVVQLSFTDTNRIHSGWLRLVPVS